MTASELICGTAWFALYALAVYLGARRAPRASPALIAMGLALAFAVAALPLGAALPVAGNFWRAWAVFCFLAVSYLMVFGAAHKSISLQLLARLLRAPGRTLGAAELFSGLIEQQSFAARLEVMLSQGFATRSAHGYALTAKGRRIAGTAHRLQGLFRIDASG